MKKIINKKLMIFCSLFTLFSSNLIAEIKEIRNAQDIKKNGKPMVVEFYSPQCPHCAVMIPRYEQAAQNNPSIACYRVNIANLNLVNDVITKLNTPESKVELRGIPHFVFIDSQGKLSEMKGQMGVDALQGKVAKLK